VLPAADVLAAAVRRAQRLAAKPSQAFQVHKRALDPITGAVVSDAEIEQTIAAWFGEEASARRRLLAQRLAEKLGKPTIPRGS
jgi:hypothetical protein